MRRAGWIAVLLPVLAAVAWRGLSASETPVLAEGVVKDPQGRPVPAVWITREGWKTRSGLTNWWRTDSQGRFRVDGVGEGEVVLRVVPGDASILEGTLVTTKAGVRDLSIVIEPGPQLFARIERFVPPKGDPAHARLVWFAPDGTRLRTRYCPIAPDGRVRFVRLPADPTFELWAGASDGPVRARNLRAGDAEVSVKASPARRIAGRVEFDRDDRRRIGVGAQPYPGFDAGVPAVVADDGTFEITGLPDGTYRVSAQRQGNPIEMPVSVEVPAGTTDVVIDLRRRR